MLKFFRRYQKIFFAIIAFIVVVTFSFFGTQGITSRINRPVDKDISKSYNGSIIKLSEIENMSYFLSTDREDISLTSHTTPNLFNDGVIRNDFIKSGLAKIFIEKYFEQIKTSFQSKYEIIQRYKPFVHFNDSSISLATTLSMINPKVLTLLKELQAQKELNLEFFNKYIELYNEQAKIQPELLRKILIYQEKQNKVEPDTRLYQDNISFFGFESTSDWFGKDFIDLISQFIINTAQVAKEKGYEVTPQEAISDLMSNLKKALNKEMKEPLIEYYKKMMGSLRIEEKKVVNIWKDVLLFRKYFNDLSNNTLVDNLAYKEFANFAKTKANIKLYKLPEYLKFKNSEDLVRFEMYLLATTNKCDALDVPNNFKSLEEIEKNYPELVEKKYLVTVRETNLEKAALRVKLKDMSLWQLEDKNWEKIKNKFAFIKVAKTKDSRLTLLEKLDFDQKAKIDEFSRLEMVKENPKLIDESLFAEAEKEYEFYLTKDATLPIQIKNSEKLFELLEKQDKIEKFTQDNKNFYSFQVMQRANEKSLITFEKAVNEKIIDKVLDRYLQNIYSKVKVIYPKRFKDDNDDYKDYESIKVELAEVVFDEVFSKIKSLNITKDKSLDALSKFRLYSFVENAKQNISSNEKYLENMNPQFKILCEDTSISRSKNPTWLEKTAFSMKEKNYSSIDISDKGNLEFFLLESVKQDPISQEKVNLTKSAISVETSALLTDKLIKTFKEKKCVVIPVRE